ncbi:carboxypeptidase-like regulatory domain-containing protein [Maribacter sp. 2307ULW6-5]
MSMALWPGQALWAQEQEFLQGKVLDKNTGEPVVFATVRINGKAKGVITNMDGGFRLPQAYREAGDSITVSSMGYRSQEYALRQLSATEPNLLYLGPGVLSLQEAVVKGKKKRPLGPVKIVRRAIKNIMQNYPVEEFASIGYYRDYQMHKGQYLNLNEALLEVWDRGFASMDTTGTRVRIYDYRPNDSFAKDENARAEYDYGNYTKIIENAYLPSYGGNEFTILRIHDALRNYNVNSFSFVNEFQYDFIGNHTFTKEADVFLGDERCYAISFKGYNSPRHRVKGMIYISRKDFAIHKMAYAVYNRQKKLPSGQVDKDGMGIEAVFEVVVEYLRQDGRMFPNFISFNNHFKVVKSARFVMERVTIDPFQGSFLLYFTQAVDLDSASKERNYKIRFMGKRLRFREIEVVENTVRLQVGRGHKEFNDFLAKLRAFPSQEKLLMENLVVRVENIMNMDGSEEVNKPFTENYLQFREFFVQETKSNSSPDQGIPFMDKYRPIFKDQPMSKPNNFNEYWMNTPLRKVSDL